MTAAEEKRRLAWEKRIAERRDLLLERTHDLFKSRAVWAGEPALRNDAALALNCARGRIASRAGWFWAWHDANHLIGCAMSAGDTGARAVASAIASAPTMKTCPRLPPPVNKRARDVDEDLDGAQEET